jgi:hypothetical protein
MYTRQTLIPKSTKWQRRSTFVVALIICLALSGVGYAVGSATWFDRPGQRTAQATSGREIDARWLREPNPVPACRDLAYFKQAHDECAKLLTLPDGPRWVKACVAEYRDRLPLYLLEGCIGQNLAVALQRRADQGARGR